MKIKQRKTQSVAPRFGRLDADLADVESAVARSRDFLLSLQHPDGYWCGELKATRCLRPTTFFCTRCLKRHPGRLRRALTEMMRYQNGDGSWSIYHFNLIIKICWHSLRLFYWECSLNFTFFFLISQFFNDIYSQND